MGFGQGHNWRSTGVSGGRKRWYLNDCILSYPTPYTHVELSGSLGGVPRGYLLSLMLSVLWPAHLTQLGTVFQSLGAADNQNFGVMEFARENLDVETFL